MISRYTLGLIIAAALATILLTQVDRASLARSLVDVDWRLLVGAMALKATSIQLKSRRWGVAIEAGSGWKADNRIFSATVVGLAGNIVLPARMGELARLRMLTRYNNVPAGFLASAAGVAYLLDAVLLSLIFAAISGMSIGSQTATRAIVLTAGTLIVAVGAAFLGERFSREPPSRRFRALVRRLPERLARPLVRHAQGLLSGFSALRQTRRMPRLVVLTLGIAACEIASMQLGLRSLGIEVSWLAAAALVVALQLSYAVPTTPGNLGAHQVVCVLVLGAFEISRAKAFGFSLAFQGMAHLTVLGLAGIVLAYEAWGTVVLDPSSERPPDSA